LPAPSLPSAILRALFPMLTPTSRKALSDTIRAVRARLLDDLAKHTQSRLQLSLPLERSSLEEPLRTQRVRLERWLDERERAMAAGSRSKRDALRQRALDGAVHECAATLLNRLVILRAMEARGIAVMPVLTGGWRSKAYREFREWAPALCEDESEGYAGLLQMVFREHALELPGVFGAVGVEELLEVPPGTLRAVVDALDDEALADAWDDDTTPGWVYQYWNDPERERLDAKLTDGGKVEPHEIASKTQMFTERYMVEWLLQNTLGLQWFALCRKKGWTAEATSVLPSLEARRSNWRAKRERGEVALDELVPVNDGLERRWCYWVEQPVPEAMVEAVGESVRQWRVLDPACGSGHFLVIAFGLLFELYREEARHRSQTEELHWTDREIAQWIVEDNLHGVDLDPRAVQLAAASVWLSMKERARDAVPRRMNLVATAFDLARLSETDEAVVTLARSLESECGLDARTTRLILQRLKGLDAWGSLVRIHRELDALVREANDGTKGATAPGQGLLEFTSRARVLEAVERFLAMHTGHADLGVRLDGSQLAAGVRFAAMMREGSFDLVVGNPPYQGSAKMADAKHLADEYPRAKADLYAAFIERGLELAKEKSGLCAMVTMRNWMFLGQYEELRKWVLGENDLSAVVDLDSGAFESVSAAQVVLSVSCQVVRRDRAHVGRSIAIRPTPTTDRASTGMTDRKRAGLLAQVGRYEFDPSAFRVIDGDPIVYWWSKELLERYAKAPKLGEVAPARFGVNTGNNARFSRCWWEVASVRLLACGSTAVANERVGWVPFVMGAGGREWCDPMLDVIDWRNNGMALKVRVDHFFGNVAWKIPNENMYFGRGVAFAKIGARFSARVHRFASVIDSSGSSVYPPDVASAVCLMNARVARTILESLNPTVNFQVGDVNRLPLFPVESAEAIYARLDEAFTEHERAREASVEFVAPGRSAWGYAQAWAQKAVDRAPGEPLPEYCPTESDWLPPDSASDPTASAAEHEKRAAFDRVSYALGVAMGRFGAQGEGVLASAPDTAVPAGILFVSATGEGDSVDTRACAPLRAAFIEYGTALTDERDLRVWLRKELFALHKERYENRPIYFPLSSEKKSFVAWVSVHRWTKNTLKELLADHLEPLRRGLDAQLKELRAAKESATDKKSKTATERKLTELSKLADELAGMIARVRQVSDEGAPPANDKSPGRERAHAFVMDLDDGVMVNSAALWPLLEAQWKDPKKWWDELSRAEGRKDYDWSKMAARYWPTRVRAKCVEDPSLAVAHGCFWELHPEKAWQWEQRLKGELGDDWVIEESGATERRAAWVAANGERAREITEDERRRRERKAKREESEESDGSEEGE